MNTELLTEQEVSGPQDHWPLFVVFTTVQDTLFCLRLVDQLSSNLSPHIQLLFPDGPENSSALLPTRILANFTVRYFLTMLPHYSKCVTKLVRYSTSSQDLWEILPPQSLVALAGPSRRFRSSPAQRLACKLRQAGHEVLFFPCHLSASKSFCIKK